MLGAIGGAVTLGTLSCGPVEYSPRLASFAPQERMLGVSEKLDALGPGDEVPIDVYRTLVSMLRSADGAERLYGIGTLEEYTGTRMGFDALLEPGAQPEAIEAWESWLEEGAPSPEGRPGTR